MTRCANKRHQPTDRGSLNSAHIHGTDVPVKEPSTASTADVLVGALDRLVRQASSFKGVCYSVFCFL
jgi:hypothetical protein